MKSLPRTALALLLAVPAAFADVRLPALLGDHMVLQRDDVVTLWGWAAPGEAVSIAASWGDETATAVADAEGRWRASFTTGTAGGPHTLTFRGANEVVLHDVLLGEVWLCGGQSNMEWSMDACQPLYVDVKAAAHHPNLRLFDVAHRVAAAPVDDVLGSWAACTPETLANFSAIGYFYGRELQEALDVPIGLVSCNWGGTVAEAWTSEAGLAAFPEFAPALEFVRECREDAEGVEARREAAIESWWDELPQRDLGSREAWQRPELDDHEWAEMQVPSNWVGTSLEAFDGLVWMRRTFTLPAGWAGREAWLELGPIDDMDTTWVNGTRVGGMEDGGNWQRVRRYAVPAGLLKDGENVVAVRVYDSGGYGGLYGAANQITLAPRDVDRPLSLAGTWRYRAGAPQRELARWPQTAQLHQNYPTALSNGMLDPVTPFAIRGAIWYQGESNRERPAQYERLFPAMIADWRARWGRGDFPFYFVQIAPFAYGGDTGEAGALRDAQRKTLAVPNTGMAVTMDIGNPRDIHPKDKLDVGHRLALWALTKTYGRDVGEWSGPLYAGLELEDGALRVRFDHAAGLGTRDGAAPSHFQVAGADRVFHPATARVDGDTVVVSSPAVALPVAVRYAWGAADEPNLANAAGLPASSFRSDAW